MNLAGPAEDFCYSLSRDRKSTYRELKDSLRERFANDTQSWIICQARRSDWTFGPIFKWLNQQVSSFTYHWYIENALFCPGITARNHERDSAFKRAQIIPWSWRDRRTDLYSENHDEISCDGHDVWTELSRRNKRNECVKPCPACENRKYKRKI